MVFHASVAPMGLFLTKGVPTLETDVLVLELVTNVEHCSVGELPQGNRDTLETDLEQC